MISTVSQVIKLGWPGAQGSLKVYRALDFPLQWQQEKVGRAASFAPDRPCFVYFY